MTNLQLDHEAIVRLCNGNREALHWIQLGRAYVHEGDDQVDEDTGKNDPVAAAKRACRLGAMALELYTHPFFLKNMASLKSVLLLNFHYYRDAVRWENSQVEWQRNFSDWARHSWLMICLAVGDICSGFDSTDNESAEMHTMSYVNHHSISGDKL